MDAVIVVLCKPVVLCQCGIFATRLLMFVSLPMERRCDVVWVPTLCLSTKHVHVPKGSNKKLGVCERPSD